MMMDIEDAKTLAELSDEGGCRYCGTMPGSYHLEGCWFMHEINEAVRMEQQSHQPTLYAVHQPTPGMPFVGTATLRKVTP